MASGSTEVGVSCVSVQPLLPHFGNCAGKTGWRTRWSCCHFELSPSTRHTPRSPEQWHSTCHVNGLASGNSLLHVDLLRLCKFLVLIISTWHTYVVAWLRIVAHNVLPDSLIPHILFHISRHSALHKLLFPWKRIGQNIDLSEQMATSRVSVLNTFYHHLRVDSRWCLQGLHRVCVRFVELEMRKHAENFHACESMTFLQSS